MRPTSRRGGFTMAELLVGLLVTSLVMTAVTAVFLGVQRAYQSETESKVMTESGRGTVQFLERVLPLAGYGIDPRAAFNMTLANTADNQQVKGVSFTPTPAAAIVGPNDSIVTDDLAFRYRDPAFLNIGQLNAAHTTLTLDRPLQVDLPVGKLLMVGCQGGNEFAYVRVGTAASAGATAVTVADDAANAPFPTNTNSCFQSTGSASPRVFLVQEHRLRIVNLDGRPWLVSFRDLRASTTDLSLGNFDPIAPDVEVFQVAYGLARSRPGGCCNTAPDAAGNGNFVIGDAPSETPFAQPANVMTTAPNLRTGYNDPSRYAAHPANIRSVHVAFIVRAPRTSPTGRKFTASTGLFNWTPGANPPDGFMRNTFHTAIQTPNTLSRTGFLPALRSASTLDDSNSWGG